MIQSSERQLAEAQLLWGSSTPISGTKAETYIRNLYVKVPIPATLRFVSNIYHSPSDTWSDAMVGSIHNSKAVHCTYFTEQGEIADDKPKAIIGECLGGYVKLTNGTGALVISVSIDAGLVAFEWLSEHDPEV
ncbi:hypothetical protein F9L33_14665 [Amylibacter sp. SFDW26]|uniref:DUF7146 domain-containing protein n=1 Tax=Amylibacter sp. SFDW26 TaxID=2652722 RepID=UPI0012626569|nr:hypothetical protein [Amylibacter sp. SFDW26]KAB7610135.1 hypothetical protein F9L33_14665 [Amylibacter sp. SFDW26]